MSVRGLPAAFAARVAVFTLALLAPAAAVRAQPITDPTQPAPPAGAPAAPATPAAPAAATPSAGSPTPAAKPAQGPLSPFTFTLAYTADMLGDVSGGLQQGGDYIDLLKLSAAYDGASSGHDGLTGLVSLEHAFGAGFTARRVGGIQAISSTEAYPGSTRLYEMWVQQALFDGRAAVKVGFTDINTTFDVQETAALFLNASNGIGPDIGDTGRNGPSDYPTPALAVTAYYRPADDWTLQGGLFDAEAGDVAHRSQFVAVKFDGALLVGQVEKRFADVARAEVGAWVYTSDFPSLTRLDAVGRPLQVGGDGGVFGLVEGRLIRQGDGGLNGWVRAGLANGEINPVASYLGGGLVYTGLIKGRDKDEIGFAVARAGLGQGAREAGDLAGRNVGPAETDLEATYRYVLTDWLNVQPDLQYVVEPHGERRVPNALVVGLRLQVTWSK